MELTILIVWGIGTAVNGMIAQERGRSVGMCILGSLLLSPLTVYMFLVATPTLKSGQEKVA